MTDKLPDKPSDLLALALSDLAKIEASPEYEVNMEDWHQPKKSGVCEVCMAAAVMAKTLKVDRFKGYMPCDFETDTGKKLMALEYFCRGDLTYALKTLGFDHPRFLVGEIDAADYDDNRKQFEKDMRAIIKALKGEGL